MLSSSNNNLQPCPIHGDLMRLYCATDKEYLCGMCFFEGKHSGHTVTKVNEDVSRQKAVVSRFVSKSSSEYSVILNELSTKVQTELDSLIENCSATKNAITTSFREAHERLDAEERRLLDKLETKTHIHENSMEEMNTLIQTTRDEIYSLTDDIGQSGIEGNPSAIAGIAQRVQIVEKKVAQIMYTRLQNTKTSFADNDISFDEYTINENAFSMNASCGPNTHTLIITWIQKIEVPLDGYALEYRESTDRRDTQFNVCYEGRECEYTLVDLKEDTEYEFRVYAVINGVKASSYSSLKSRTEQFLYNNEGYMCNSDGDTVHIGSNSGKGRIYCGKKKNQCKCGHCDGRCGPTNGCPCDSCELLTKKVYSSVKCPRDHPFSLVIRAFTCNTCGSSYRRPWASAYRCAICNYDLCFKCAYNMLPIEIKSKIIPNP